CADPAAAESQTARQLFALARKSNSLKTTVLNINARYFMSPLDLAGCTVKSKHVAKVMNDRPYRLWILLTLLLAASFALRVAAWAYWQTGAIESEGAEYARIAANLRNGVGYVGIVTPGAQLNFNPLFPLLIAGTSFL